MSNIDILSLTKEKIEDFCRRNSIRTLAFFGSVLRTDFTPNSDVDVLVEFEKGKGPGFIGLARMEWEFSEIVGGRQADFRTAQDLSKYIRDEVVATARVVYVQCACLALLLNSAG